VGLHASNLSATGAIWLVMLRVGGELPEELTPGRPSSAWPVPRGYAIGSHGRARGRAGRGCSKDGRRCWRTKYALRMTVSPTRPVAVHRQIDLGGGRCSGRSGWPPRGPVKATSNGRSSASRPCTANAANQLTWANCQDVRACFPYSSIMVCIACCQFAPRSVILGQCHSDRAQIRDAVDAGADISSCPNWQHPATCSRCRRSGPSAHADRSRVRQMVSGGRQFNLSSVLASWATTAISTQRVMVDADGVLACYRRHICGTARS